MTEVSGRVTQHGTAERDLGLGATDVGFLLSPSGATCEHPGKSCPWVSTVGSRKLSYCYKELIRADEHLPIFLLQWSVCVLSLTCRTVALKLWRT